MNEIENKSLLTCLVEPSDNTIEIHNPASGEVIGYINKTSPEQLNDVVEMSQLAQQSWKKKSGKERASHLRQWFDLINQNREDLARILTLEQGKPLAEALGEVTYGASFIEWFSEEAKRSYGSTIPAATSDKRLLTIKQPVGVACAITPWNFPIAMITRKAAPALAAGCSFIVKPSELTPLSAFAIAELAYQAGIPKALLSVVCHNQAAMIGDIFTSHPVIRKLSFTGSTKIGRLLMEQCAASVKRTSMELGGNAPFIIFDDADIDKAVQGAIVAKFRNAGQTCVCANRFYVHSAVHDKFVEKLAAAIQKMKIGNGLEEGVVIGPLINQAAKDKVSQLIDQAQQQGAEVHRFHDQQSGLFVPPVILTNVKHSMDIVQEEIFGPVAPIICFNNDQELIEMANDTIYGLAAYFYSQNISRIWHVAEALEYGMVGINEGLISTEVAPFGGVKQSGIGREGAKEGLEEYLETKYLCFGS